jgi:hypothetical protein
LVSHESRAQSEGIVVRRGQSMPLLQRREFEKAHFAEVP